MYKFHGSSKSSVQAHVALDSQATATVGKGMAPDPTNTPWEFAS